MNIKGTLTICDCCGFKIFRKGKISFSKYHNSLGSNYNSLGSNYGAYFEDIDPVPESWANYGDEHLCPQCAKKWKKAISKEE